MTKNDARQPADTRTMNIVHQALRRDLQRATTALEAIAPPGDRQRVAIADHIGWMMEILRAHHDSEDEGLYPAVRARRRDAAALLDEMDRDHQKVARSIDSVEHAAAAYGSTDDSSARSRLVVAISELEDVLLPHLQREEELVLPIVSAALSHAEWQALEQEHSLKGKTTVQLGREGHWLIDDASPSDRDTVLGLVSAVPRFALLHGYGPIYRRQRDACWSPSKPGPRQVQKHGHNEVIVAADPDDVWKVVLDITRVGEWSHECRSCSFLDGATRAEPGARFRGRNRQGIIRWGRVCEVLSTENRELVWRTVPSTFYPDSSVWRIRVTGTDGGTRLEQSFNVVRAPKFLDVIYATMVPAHRDRAAALTDDLRRLGELASERQVDDVAQSGALHDVFHLS